MSKFNYKPYIVGFIAGVIATVSTGAYATVGDKVEAIFSEFNFKVNGKAVTLDQTPIVVDGSSYLPVKSLSQALGYNVNYDADTRTINLSNQPSTPVAQVDNQIYYSLSEVGRKQIDAGNTFVSSFKSIDGVMKNILIFNNSNNIADSNKDYYYDRTNDKGYYSENFLLKVVSKEELANCSLYHVDRINNKVTIQK